MYTFIFASTKPGTLPSHLAALGKQVSGEVAAWHTVVEISEQAGKAFIASYHGHVQYTGNTTVTFG